MIRRGSFLCLIVLFALASTWAVAEPTPEELAQQRRRFDAWRDSYNLGRPHRALGLQPPVSRHRPSARPFPESLPPIEHSPGDQARKAQDKGEFSFHGRTRKVSKAFHGHPVGLRPLSQDGCFDAYFCQHKIAFINLNEPQ